jgi:hypothetical protein
MQHAFIGVLLKPQCTHLSFISGLQHISCTVITDLTTHYKQCCSFLTMYSARSEAGAAIYFCDAEFPVQEQKSMQWYSAYFLTAFYSFIHWLTRAILYTYFEDHFHILVCNL